MASRGEQAQPPAGPDPGANEAGLNEALEYFNDTLERVLAGEELPLHPFLSPDCELVNFEPSPFPGTYRGEEGFRRWTHDLFDDFTDARIEAVEVVPDGDLMAVRMRLSGKGRSSGIEGSFEWGCLISVENGLCTRAASDPTFERTLERLEEERAQRD